MTEQATSSRLQVNLVGLSKADYRGNPSTLCQGCGHNSISSQIVAACYEMNIVPENIVKFSGIGCSSKSPTYFLNRSFGFNGLHGRMPSGNWRPFCGSHASRPGCERRWRYREYRHGAIQACVAP